MLNFKLKFTQEGVTLIEMLVVLSIIAILSAVLFIGKSVEEAKIALQMAAYNLNQDFRELQEMAMGAGEVDCGGDKTHRFGIQLKKSVADSYILFADCDNDHERDDSDQDLKKVKLEKRVQICDLSEDTLNVVFVPPDPTVYINEESIGQEGVVTLCLKDSPAQQKKVKINSVGRVEIE